LIDTSIDIPGIHGKKDILQVTFVVVNARPLYDSCPFSILEPEGTTNTLGQFTQFGKHFSTLKEKAEHTRSHVRFTTKFGSTLSCFFGDCATMPPNARTSKDRDGPMFVSGADQLQHVWVQHQLTTLKAIDQHFASSATNGFFNRSLNAVIAASPWVERFFRVSDRSVTTMDHSLSISASPRLLRGTFKAHIQSTY
jgi:hypothetical protein